MTLSASKRHGIHFIAASGRQYKNLQRLFAPVKNDISYVAENGSMCVHDGKIVSLGHIDTDLIYEIADAAKEYGHCHTLISTARTGYTDSKDSDYIDHIRNDVGYDMDVVQNVRDIKEPFIKIAVCDFDGTEKRLRAYFQERFGDRIKIVTSGNIWIVSLQPGMPIKVLPFPISYLPLAWIQRMVSHSEISTMIWKCCSCPTQAMP